MSQHIRDVLNRRSDLSTFIVHLTRDSESGTASANLRSIIRERRLIARTPMGWAARQVEESPESPACISQRVVCFSETPLEHVYSLVADISRRKVKLRPYGLVLTKMRARGMGINPIWYVDCTPGHDWDLAKALDKIRDESILAGGFETRPAAALLPFAEPMGTWGGHNREWWWEREWRHRGDVMLRGPRPVALWLCPADEIASVAEEVIAEFGSPCHIVDPTWGLEEIIAHLVGETEVSPFSPH